MNTRKLCIFNAIASAILLAIFTLMLLEKTDKEKACEASSSRGPGYDGVWTVEELYEECMAAAPRCVIR